MNEESKPMKTRIALKSFDDLTFPVIQVKAQTDGASGQAGPAATPPSFQSTPSPTAGTAKVVASPWKRSIPPVPVKAWAPAQETRNNL